MKYAEQFVNSVVAAVSRQRCSARQAERLLGVPRKTIARWLSRALGALPFWFSRAPKRVPNRTPQGVLDKMLAFLEEGKSSVITWLALKGQACLRTVQRWKSKWFPLVQLKVKPRRYERRKVHSLSHTDWAVKRIREGKRCCFTFYVDDASRRLYACRAYSSANQENTLDAFNTARKHAPFRAVLTDCGRVYTKTFGGACHEAGVKSIHTRPYNPQCNGKAEAVVKKIKRFLSKFEVRDLEHANRLLRRFEFEYNRTPHSSLKYQTPLQRYKEKQAVGDISAVT